MSDADLIDAMGGPTAVAKLLGFEAEHAAQRVNNWKTRGIPARVLVDHRLVFERARRRATQQPEPAEQEA